MSFTDRHGHIELAKWMFGMLMPVTVAEITLAKQMTAAGLNVVGFHPPLSAMRVHSMPRPARPPEPGPTQPMVMLSCSLLLQIDNSLTIAGSHFTSLVILVLTIGQRTPGRKRWGANSRTRRWDFPSTPTHEACRTLGGRSDWGFRNNERAAP